MRLTILRFDSIDSTNLEALRQAKSGAPEGLCIVAREQTHGRGRHERVWISPRDAGLYFSMLLRPRFDVSVWPLLTLMAALAISRALEETCSLQTDIKWPNDVVINDRKLCGILAETVETDQGLACVLGMGVNLTREAVPPELDDIATSVESVTDERPNLERLLEALTEALAEAYEILRSPGGGAATLSAWRAASSYAEGKRIRVTNGKETLEGVTRGLEPDGGLRVETSTGEIRIVRSGDVTTVRPSP